jgi:TetR/AcrR family transcriptional regulator
MTMVKHHESTTPTRKPSRAGSRGRPEESRQAILKAALAEFSSQGIAGARTDAIAESAGVNKALLYYYFEDKEGLYRACMEYVFSGLMERVRPVLAAPGNSLEKLVRYAVTHFDYIAESPSYSRIVQGELMRAGVGKSPHMQYLGEKYFKKFMESLMTVLTDGIRRGEIRSVDAPNTIVSIMGLTVFYFVSTPVARAIGRHDPFSPESLRARRLALVDHVTAILRPDNSKPARGKTL